MVFIDLEPELTPGIGSTSNQISFDFLSHDELFMKTLSNACETIIFLHESSIIFDRNRLFIVAVNENSCILHVYEYQNDKI